MKLYVIRHGDPDYKNDDFPPCAVTVFEFENNENGITTPFCKAFADTSHFYNAGLPLKF